MEKTIQLLSASMQAHFGLSGEKKPLPNAYERKINDPFDLVQVANKTADARDLLNKSALLYCSLQYKTEIFSLPQWIKDETIKLVSDSPRCSR